MSPRHGQDGSFMPSPIVKPRLIKTKLLKPETPDWPDHYGLSFAGLTQPEAIALIDCVIKIEQARTGEILSPTECGDRFLGLDLDTDKS